METTKINHQALLELMGFKSDAESRFGGGHQHIDWISYVGYEMADKLLNNECNEIRVSHGLQPIDGNPETDSRYL